MKIMSFNIQHCRYFPEEKIRFEPFAEEILSSGADIIGLNEVRGKGFIKGYTDQTKKLSSLTGYYSYFGKAISVKGIAPYGNAILSRFPIISAETVKIPDPVPKTGQEMYESRCIIKAVIKAKEEYTVIVTHMGLNKDERESAVKAILEIAPEEKCIIMGDFNCTPEKEEISPLFGKYICPDVNDFTFPSDNPDKKIDYIFVSKDIITENKGTSEHIVSDHRSIWAQIKEN